MKNLKNFRFYLLAVTVIFAFASCSKLKNKVVVEAMNKQFPISANGITIQNAEALPNNVIKINCLVTDPIFDSLDSTAIESMIPSMKNSGIFALRNQPDYETIKSIRSNFIYEYKTAKGKVFQMKITADEISNAKNIDKSTANTSMLNVMLNTVKSQLPITVNEEAEMILTDVYIEGESTFVYVYSIPQKNIVSTDSEVMKSVLTESVSSDQSLITILKQGINLKYLYRTPEGEELVQCVITKEDL